MPRHAARPLGTASDSGTKRASRSAQAGRWHRWCDHTRGGNTCGAQEQCYSRARQWRSSRTEQDRRRQPRERPPGEAAASQGGHRDSRERFRACGDGSGRSRFARHGAAEGAFPVQLRRALRSGSRGGHEHASGGFRRLHAIGTGPGDVLLRRHAAAVGPAVARVHAAAHVALARKSLAEGSVTIKPRGRGKSRATGVDVPHQRREYHDREAEPMVSEPGGHHAGLLAHAR